MSDRASSVTGATGATGPGSPRPLAGADAPGGLNGVINLDKPPGMSSARAVSIVKRLLPRASGGSKPKIGHAGTLDPFATGVLLLLIGKATKACERLMDSPKQYEATVYLGATTATDDPESPTVPWAPAHGGAVAPVLPDRIPLVLAEFVGEILQRPPAYSALKVDGRRAYDLARKGAEVVLEPRPVRVYGIELLGYDWPLLRLRIDCGRGTYIRSLARDIGERLDVGGHLTELRRIRVGSYAIEGAVTPARLEAEGLEAHLRAVT